MYKFINYSRISLYLLIGGFACFIIAFFTDTNIMKLMPHMMSLPGLILALLGYYIEKTKLGFYMIVIQFLMMFWFVFFL